MQKSQGEFLSVSNRRSKYNLAENDATENNIAKYFLPPFMGWNVAKKAVENTI